MIPFLLHAPDDGGGDDDTDGGDDEKEGGRMREQDGERGARLIDDTRLTIIQHIYRAVEKSWHVVAADIGLSDVCYAGKQTLSRSKKDSDKL